MASTTILTPPYARRSTRSSTEFRAPTRDTNAAGRPRPRTQQVRRAGTNQRNNPRGSRPNSPHTDYPDLRRGMPSPLERLQTFHEADPGKNTIPPRKPRFSTPECTSTMSTENRTQTTYGRTPTAERTPRPRKKNPQTSHDATKRYSARERHPTKPTQPASIVQL